MMRPHGEVYDTNTFHLLPRLRIERSVTDLFINGTIPGARRCFWLTFTPSRRCLHTSLR